jgi:hypothetical protein
MYRVIIPDRYITETTMAPSTFGYTRSEEWLTQDVVDWILEHNIQPLLYDSMLCNFYLRFEDEELAMQFKLTFPS